MKIKNTYQPKIVIVGSSSVDLVLNTDHHPQPNETVLAKNFENFFGGKGANQAVATARLGASVYFVGAVGMDPYGQQVIRNLVDEHVNVGFVAEKTRHETGTAYVTSAKGKTSIVVVPAANNDLNHFDIDIAEKIIFQADLVLTQLEIPMTAVEYLFKKCKELGVKIGIYAAPAKPLSLEIIDYAEFIVAKSNDLSTIFGEESREDILKKLPNKLFVRDDSNSTVFFDGNEMKYYRNDPEEMAHKMGMGDAFTSSFAIAYCHGNSISDCVKFGNDVSRKVAANKGSQGGLPFLKDVI